ncbi:MAG: hypothetical protein JHC95_16650, partial [Solirubrobacteraceae bacterium]|nr:hypothetical protein [Solirubrobacteraceae bacterium]
MFTPSTTTRRATLSAAAILSALSFGMADAQASTVGRIFGPDLNEFSNDRVIYHGSNLQDDLKITKSGLNITFEDPNQVITPTDASCVSINAHKVRCDSKEGFAEGQIEGVQAYLDQGDDEALVLASDGISVLVDGEEGDDELTSGDARHSLLGGDGEDTLLGNGGNDLLQGNAGPDHIVPGAGEDEVYGGPAADTIEAKDGQVDDIDCGSGLDTFSADASDVKSGCELANGFQQLDPPAPPAPQDPPAGE